MSIESEINRAIKNGNDVEIIYEKYDGETSKRRVSNLSYNNEFGGFGYQNAHIQGYCHLRKENRTFRISRIKSVRVIPSTSSSKNKSTCIDINPYLKDLKLPTYSVTLNKNTSISDNTRNKSQVSIPKSNSTEGCYIATMAYGSYDHPQVMILRRYRDDILKKNYLWKIVY